MELKAMNCEYGQGYYFSRALNAESALGLLSSDAGSEVSGPLVTAEDDPFELPSIDSVLVPQSVEVGRFII
jgi:hypothetical protein